MRRIVVAVMLAGLVAACETPPTTAPNTVPLEIGMTPAAAETALGVPLVVVDGTPGQEVYLARLAAATPGLYTVDGLIYLQFRKGKLTGWKRDWRIGPSGRPI